MTVQARFEDIGARVRVREVDARPEPALVGPRINIRSDKRGEFFDLVVPNTVELEVLDSDRDDRHLLLLARAGREKSRFLCGHDERHWFVAAIPERTPVSTVEDAKVSLQPAQVASRSAGLARRERVRRKNAAFVRQGEWFFLPEPDFSPGPKDMILHNEPITRDRRSTPHIVEQAVRTGGERRWLPEPTKVPRSVPLERRQEINGALGSATAFNDLTKRGFEARFPEVQWRSVIVNPTMYVRGAVRHSDHSTLRLSCWHRVAMNTENLARASTHVVFID